MKEELYMARYTASVLQCTYMRVYMLTDVYTHTIVLKTK